MAPRGEAAAPAETAGILPSQRIRKLIQGGEISARTPILPDQVQPASLDLRLGPLAYRVRASFLPNQSTVAERLNAFAWHEIDLTTPAVLERGCVYIIPLQEELRLPPELSGKANPKSTTGRLDIFTRLITDRGAEFERVPPGYAGRLYVEVVPRTFSVLVSQGMRLNQLRLWRGNAVPSDARLLELHATQALLYAQSQAPADAFIDGGVWVSVDLSDPDGAGLIGYRAKRYAPAVDLALVRHYDPQDFWDPIYAQGRRQIILDPDEFHILASRERVRIPPDFAAEMVGYDPSVGEFRVHYAGFFDPGFGDASAGGRGTRAVLEVRSHEVPFVLEDGQRVARLIFESLQDVPDCLYGPSIGSSYQTQGLALSKQFKSAPW